MGILEQGFEGVFGGKQAELLSDVFESLKGVFVGGGLGDLGEGVVEESEVGVDGGVGDLEEVGDLTEGVSALVEFLGLEDALASFGGEGGHGGWSFRGTNVLMGDGSRVWGKWGSGGGGFLPAQE